MSLVDSAAVFEGRARTIGLSDQVLTALWLRGWTTHATFAFSVATQPGPDEQAFADGVIVPILGEPDHMDAPNERVVNFFFLELKKDALGRICSSVLAANFGSR